MWVVTFSKCIYCCTFTVYFNPHHPCGWWLFLLLLTAFLVEFQSTPPVWVVTVAFFLPRLGLCISIHTTRVGGDRNTKIITATILKFQSTPPVWVVTDATYSMIYQNFCISIHTTRVGGDGRNLQYDLSKFLYFNPHHPCGWWHSLKLLRVSLCTNFNPHHPCGWWLFHF